jgi:hypothetical protein
MSVLGVGIVKVVMMMMIYRFRDEKKYEVGYLVP